MAKNYETDYMKLMQEAAEKGDYKTAAQYEQQRNEKIADLGLNYDTTSNYAGWLDSTDCGTIGKEQMASGASWQDVLQTYEDRYNKAANTVGLTQYANDDVQKEMWDYITANMQTAAGYTMPTYSYDTSSKPTYTSNYSARIDEMLNQILNRQDFSYNAETDPLFQQYKTQYNREGNRSMNDTLAAAASQAGGMNSYAMTAAQQANNYYATQLNDKIPELYQLAYEMYLTDIDQQVRDLGLLQDMDDTQYSRYRDTMSDWYNDRDFAYNQYRDSMGDYQWGKSFEYNASRDQVADDQWQQSFDHSVLQDDINNKYRQEQADIANDQWQQSFDREGNEVAYNKAMEILNSGTMPTDDQLAAAGITADQASSILALVKAGYNMSLYGNPDGYVAPKYEGGSGGSGGSGGGDGNDGPDYNPTTEEIEEKMKDVEIQGKPLAEYEAAAGNYQEMKSMCEELYNTEGKAAVLDMLREAYKTGALNLTDYSTLYGRYRNKD